MIALESFQSARRALGPVEKGMRRFLVTRGQFTMVDLVFEILAQTSGPARISVWAWAILDSEGQAQKLLDQVCRSPRLTEGVMIVDGGKPGTEDTDEWLEATANWCQKFGENSVKNVNIHAKIVTLEVDGLRFLIRGSMNLLKTPRFENLDISEGQAEFQVVREAEQRFPHRRPPTKRLPGLSRGSQTVARLARTHETVDLARRAIGPVFAGMDRFLLTGGEFGMIDVVESLLNETGPAQVTLWTWVIAEYEVLRLRSLHQAGRITSAQLAIHAECRGNSVAQDVASRIREFQAEFGPASVRYVGNHAKMATVTRGSVKFLIRGSLNWNHCRKIEQIDITEGGPAVELVHRIESDLQILPDDCTTSQVYRASGLENKLAAKSTRALAEVKTWNPQTNGKAWTR